MTPEKIVKKVIEKTSRLEGIVKGDVVEVRIPTQEQKYVGVISYTKKDFWTTVATRESPETIVFKSYYLDSKKGIIEMKNMATRHSATENSGVYQKYNQLIFEKIERDLQEAPTQNG